MQVKTCTATVKAAGAHDGVDEGVVEAIVAAYNVDSVGDRIVPGAFKNTLERRKASGNPIPFVWNHKSDDPESYVGEVLEAEERDEGLWVKAKMDLDEPRALKVYKLLKGRRVNQFSFAYSEVDARPVAKSDDGALKELHELDIYECGPTMLGCNQTTALLDVKSQPPVTVNVHNGPADSAVLSGANTNSLGTGIRVHGDGSITFKGDVIAAPATPRKPLVKGHGMTARDLRAALDVAISKVAGGPGLYVWCRDYTDEWVVYSVDHEVEGIDVAPGLYQQNYTVTDGVVTLAAERIEVVERTEYAPVPAADPQKAADAEIADGIAALTKAGRTLSARNVAALQEALATIQKVLASATTEPKQDDAPDGDAGKTNTSSVEKATPAEPADTPASQTAPQTVPDAKVVEPAAHGTASARLRHDLAMASLEAEVAALMT